MNSKSPLVRPEQIEQAILLIRGQRVMLERDLAALYGVTTGNLNKAVQRTWRRESEASHLGFLSHLGFQTSEFALTSVPP